MFFRPSCQLLSAAASSAVLLGVLAFSSCVQATNSDTSSSSASVDFSNAAAYKINFASSQTITLTASGLYGKTLILAKLNTGGTTAAASDTGTVTLTSPSGSASSRSLRSASSISGLPPPRRPHPLAGSSTAADARSASSRAFSSSSRLATISYGESNSAYVAGTTTARFWVDYYSANGSLAGFDTINALLKKVTAHAYIWVATSNATVNNEASGSFTPSSDIDSPKIDLLADAFEAVVFPETTAIYGYERGGGTGGNGGVDGDQHISILVYDIDFDAAASASTGYVAGYFWSKDDAAASTSDVYAASGSYPSNGREIFYLDAWALQNHPYTIVSTLAHEFQHMINYNMEAYNGRASASTWLDEFRSLATEDLLAPAFKAFSAAKSYSGVSAYSFTTDGPGFWAYYYNIYSNSYPYFGLNVWSSSLYDYAFASMFASYLLRSYGGVQFMNDEIAQANAGTAAETGFIAAAQAAAARAANTDGTAAAPGALSSFTSGFYAEILAPFSYALWGLGSTGTSGATPYTRTDTKAASAGAARVLNAFTVRAANDDYTIYPGCYALSASVALPARSFTYHTDSALTGMTRDTAAFTLTKPESTNVEYRLIVIR